MKGLTFKATYKVMSPSFLKEDRFYKVVYCGHDFNVIVDVVDQERCTVSFSHSSPYLSLSSGEHTFYKNFEAIGAFEVVN